MPVRTGAAAVGDGAGVSDVAGAGVALYDRAQTLEQLSRTEADRKATPPVAAPAGFTLTTGKGQKVSLERGAHTRSKKNPGKRPRKGG